MYELLVLDRNTWNHTTVCKLFVLDRDNLYCITVGKKCLKKQVHKKCAYEYTMNAIL